MNLSKLDKRIVCDVDGTICFTEGGDYENSIPDVQFISHLNEYYENGFYIILFTSRNMNTFNGDLRQITRVTLPILQCWLNNNNCKYHELIIGKPWCGHSGFYIDDKAIRPAEFKDLTFEEISQLIS